MNDPHVVALYYRLESVSGTYDFEHARACDVKVEGFEGRIEDCRLELRPLDHFASAEKARDAVAPLLRAWEMMEFLQQRRPVFRLVPDGADVIDRSPPSPSAIPARATPPEPPLPAPPGAPQVIGGSPAVVHVTATVGQVVLSYGSYPKPPSACPPLLRSLLDRIDAYYQRSTREFLTAAGYFVLSRLQEEYGGSKAKAAVALNVDLAVLNELGRLTSSHDPKVGRKGRNKGGPAFMSGNDLDLVERIMARLVRRVAEATTAAANSLPKITLANLG